MSSPAWAEADSPARRRDRLVARHQPDSKRLQVAIGCVGAAQATASAGTEAGCGGVFEVRGGERPKGEVHVWQLTLPVVLSQGVVSRPRNCTHGHLYSHGAQARTAQ